MTMKSGKNKAVYFGPNKEVKLADRELVIRDAQGEPIVSWRREDWSENSMRIMEAALTAAAGQSEAVARYYRSESEDEEVWVHE